MACPEITGRKLELDAYGIVEFCRQHGISRATYYVLKKRGLQPDETYVLDRILITKESAAKWRKERTAASKQRTRTRSRAVDLPAKEIA
jgi:hypothetical protein